MLEKLIEYWLDNISERGYQPAFCQILIGEGHTIIHSTRHTSLEFGKDIISLDSSGTPCAFQLKGNPGSRLTLTQFREIQPQLTELVEQPISYPGTPNTPHKCYLVTNGQVEEEVQHAIKGLNEGFEQRGFHQNNRIKVLSRGQLLAWTQKHVGNYWPNDFSIHEKLIHMLNVDGRDPTNLELFSNAMDQILCLSEKRQRNTKTDFVRSVTSAGIFTALAIRNYTKEKNHIAVLGALVTYIVGCIAASERYNQDLKDGLEQPLLVARQEVFSTILDLLNEVSADLQGIDKQAEANGEETDLNQLFLHNSDPVTDRLLWNPRALKTISLFSVLNIEMVLNPCNIDLTQEQKDVMKRVAIPGRTKFNNIWGEGAIPQLLAYIWSWRISDPTMKPDIYFFGLLKWISQTIRDKGFIPTPYHTLEECIRHQVQASGFLDISDSSVEKETQKYSSFFAEALLHCFVRMNFKSSAKIIWPDLTRLIHRNFIPSSLWEYCLWRSENGDNNSIQFKPRKEWSELQYEASNVETPNIPTYFRNDPTLLLLFLIYYPHRAIPEVIRYLHYRICKTWHLPFPQPNNV